MLMKFGNDTHHFLYCLENKGLYFSEDIIYLIKYLFIASVAKQSVVLTRQ